MQNLLISRKKIAMCVPTSIVNDIFSFVFYDNHPRDENKIDIIVCTSKLEIIEFYLKKPILNIVVKSKLKPKDFLMHRNSNGDIYYMLLTTSELFIYSRKTSIELLKKLDNVERIALDDPLCHGHVNLRVWFADDAMPIVFNEKFEESPEIIRPQSNEVSDNNLPLINTLKSKLNEARYIVAQNETVYNDIVGLRQTAAYIVCRNMYPEHDDSIFGKDFKEIFGGLRIQIDRPWVKLCNRKIIITFCVLNDSNEDITDVEAVLHSEHKSIIQYETKLYQSSIKSPFWIEHRTNSIPAKTRMNIVMIVDMNEFQYSIVRNVEISGIILYKCTGEQKFLPYENIALSHSDTINEKFDVLSFDSFDNIDLLAIIAALTKTDLVLTQMNQETQKFILQDMFCKYLKMEVVSNANNMVIHKQSPYHALNGVTILINEENNVDGLQFSISVFSRFQDQVLSLIHYVYEEVPCRLLFTLPETEISEKTGGNILPQHSKQNIIGYGNSVSNQITTALKYYDECLVKMGQSNKQHIINMLGSKIDLLIGGQNKFKEFVKNIEDGIENSFNVLNSTVINEVNSDIMIIDDDD